MATIQELVEDFLRDAQYRIAEIQNEMESLDDQDFRFELLKEQREDLYLFMHCIYIGQWNIKDGYNHLDWDDWDIQNEMEYLRESCEMITSPFVTFVGNYPSIVESLGSSFGDALPSGTPQDYIYYDANGNAVTAPFPVQAGATDSDTPSTYFQ